MAVGKFNKKSVKSLKLAGKRVLLRADYNVPVKQGHITDDYRLKASLPTIKYILEQKPAALIIISHLGRPEGVDRTLTLQPVATRLEQLLDRRVRFAPDCLGPRVETMASLLKPGDIMMLENLRFHDGEEANDKKFAQTIVDATGAQVFIQDAFGVVHRAHASTDALANLLPSAAGLLLQIEVETIDKLMNKPETPVISIIGGAKISDKIEVLEKLIELSDCLAIGGAMANNFLLAEGYKIGKSIYDSNDLAMTRKILTKARSMEKQRPFRFLLPVDVVVSSRVDGKAPTRIVDLASHSLSDIENYPHIPPLSASSVGRKEMILDIGPITAGYYAGAARLAKTVIWNGTMGVTETLGIAGTSAPFAHGSHALVRAMTAIKGCYKPYSFVGGGDTVGFLEAEGVVDNLSFVSTGGGAALELMAGHKLPGVEVLPPK